MRMFLFYAGRHVKLYITRYYIREFFRIREIYQILPCSYRAFLSLEAYPKIFHATLIVHLSIRIPYLYR